MNLSCCEAHSYQEMGDPQDSTGGEGGGGGGASSSAAVGAGRPSDADTPAGPRSQSLYCPADDIVIGFDGTWCGEAAGTTGNIQILTEAFAMGATYGASKTIPSTVRRERDDWENPWGEGGATTKERHFTRSDGREVYVRYFEGPGLDGSFHDYMVNGALALDIKEHCVKVYSTIVRRFKPAATTTTTSPQSRVWLFGLSRGAFIVRTVAGMINNCGILDIREEKRSGIDDYDQLMLAAEGVYDIYRSTDPFYEPDSQFCSDFRSRKGHVTSAPPIRFLGLLDTVGALGVPRIVAGGKLGYELYDQKVSSEVQTVCQALAIHDRLGPFDPCFVRRKHHQQHQQKYPGIQLETEEVWFPGSHYDIGRQRFTFLRNNDDVIAEPQQQPPAAGGGGGGGGGLLSLLFHPISAAAHVISDIKNGNALGHLLDSLGDVANEVGRRLAAILLDMETHVRDFNEHCGILRIDYTPDLADPPLLYLIKRVQRVDHSLLPHLGKRYLDYLKDDPDPVTRHPNVMTIDAYDDMFEKLGQVNVLRDVVQLLSKQALGDRHLPVYPPQGGTLWAVYSPDGDGETLNRRPDWEQQADAGRSVHYRSKAFKRYRLLQIYGQHRYVSGPDFEILLP